MESKVSKKGVDYLISLFNISLEVLYVTSFFTSSISKDCESKSTLDDPLSPSKSKSCAVT